MTHLRPLTFSTYFSGIGCPEIALDLLSRGFSHFIGCDQLHVRNLSACEIRMQSQCELRMLDNPPQCVFGDKNLFLKAEIRTLLLSEAHRLNVDDLMQLFTSFGQVVQNWAPCVLHPSNPCILEPALLHAAGTPRPAWSSQRCHVASASGRHDFIVFLVWVALRRLVQEEAIIHENVPQFPVNSREIVLGDMDVIETIVYNCTHLSSLAERKRRFSFLRHKRSCVSQIGRQIAYVNWWGLVAREKTISWDVLLLASDSEIVEAVRAACSR